MPDADVLVVGLGAMGTAVSWRLAARGVDVIGLEQFTPGHARGSSHGESRIIRTAYYEGTNYVRLVQAAFPLWRELEERTGQGLLTLTGALMIGREDGVVVPRTLLSAREHGLPHEVLDERAMARRFPVHRLEPGEVAVFEPQAGILRPEAAVLAAARQAEHLGARLLTSTRAKSIALDGEHVEVKTAERVFRARRLVVTAGAWLGRLLPGYSGSLVVSRQVMSWLPVGDPGSFRPERFPVFLHEMESDWYGFPTLDGATIKVGIHDQGPAVDPDSMSDHVADSEAEPICRLAAASLKGVSGRPRRSVACMYTNTPDQHFLVGWHGRRKSVLVLGGFSGHGFKFAPMMGEIAAQLLCDGRTEHDLVRFEPARFS
jgi:sarcosine oxidase